MSLRWKVVCSLAAVSALFAGTTYAIQRWIIVPGFLAAEHAQAQTDLARCGEALRRDGEHLARYTRDWAAWDDTYQFIQDGNEPYSAANLIPATFTTGRLTLIALARLDGTLVWGEARDHQSQETIPMPEFFRDITRPGHPLIAHSVPETWVSGLLLTEVGPMLVCSQPIVTSEDQGPVRGAMIMGRLLDDTEVKELAERTRVVLHLWTIPGSAIPEEDRMALGHLERADATWMRSDNDKTLRGYTIVRDIFDQPALLLRADLPRTISRRGLAAANLATATSLAGGLALLLVLWIMLQRSVLGPLTTLTRHAVRVGTDCDLRVRLNMAREDEIGVLAREFDRMVVNLAEYRAQLLDAARRAGMADVAVEVLHNVGNVLNSVNVSANVVTEKLRRSEAPGLGQAAQLVAEHQGDLARFLADDERGRQLPVYLAELAKYLTAEQDTMLAEMKTLSESIEHIKQVIASQKERSSTAQMMEPVDPAALVDEALRLNANSFKKYNISVVRQCDRLGEVLMDRHKVLQILVNLLKNAKNALREGGQPDRRIMLRLEKKPGSDGDRLRFIVADNGIGVTSENLKRIFSFGFSTRENGSGYGLHSAANLAREMSGTLSAASDGLNQGATFTLEIPMAREQVLA